MKIKKGDTVKIMSGKDRTKSGKIFKVFPRERKVVIEGLNLIVKHKKPKKSGEKGQKIEIARPISSCKVMLICPKCGKTVRVGYKMTDKTKARICKKCKEEI